MTIQNDLQSLKTIAKRIAREKRIPHHEALDLIAKNLGHPHWNALTAAYGSGWRPQSSKIEALAEISSNADMMKIPVLGIGQGITRSGFIDGHPYSLEVDFEVVMGGNGWAILLDHAPSDKPVVEIYNTMSGKIIRSVIPNSEGKLSLSVTMRWRRCGPASRQTGRAVRQSLMQTEGPGTLFRRGYRTHGTVSTVTGHLRDHRWPKTCGIVQTAMRRP
jgi:hypothetical protein